MVRCDYCRGLFTREGRCAGFSGRHDQDCASCDQDCRCTLGHDGRWRWSWPGVLERIAQSNVRNYTIFLREPENLLFGYWEYHGSDFAADMAAIAADPETQRWWQLCGPCQQPLASRAPGEHWAFMEPVFHTD